MRKILIPTDFSKNALNAIKYATELFKHGPTEIYLLHVFTDAAYDANINVASEIFDELKQKTLQESTKALQDVQKEIFSFSPNPKHTIHTISEFGPLVDTVNDWVEKENIDIVVMGTKGETDDKKITFGSNTLQVIKFVKCPVLAIPQTFDDVHPKNILFPTDYQLPYQRRELKLLSTLAKCFASKINFCHISKFSALSQRQEDNKNFLETSLCDNQVNFHKVSGNNVTRTINTYLIENPVDMLVMVNTHHSYLENILHQSTIEKIGLKIDIPFLVLQNLPR